MDRSEKKSVIKHICQKHHRHIRPQNHTTLCHPCFQRWIFPPLFAYLPFAYCLLINFQYGDYAIVLRCILLLWVVQFNLYTDSAELWGCGGVQRRLLPVGDCCVSIVPLNWSGGGSRVDPYALCMRWAVARREICAALRASAHLVPRFIWAYRG